APRRHRARARRRQALEHDGAGLGDPGRPARRALSLEMALGALRRARRDAHPGGGRRDALHQQHHGARRPGGMVPIRLLAVIALLSLGAEVRAECIDQELAEKASYKRRRRGRVPRDFVKAQRHEISVNAGYYVSDLFSATYVLGGSYTYHMTEDT